MNTKNEIKQKLMILFAKEGIESITTKELLEVAEVSNGKFFHYFKNKEVLLSELFEDVQNELYFHLSSNVSEDINLYDLLWSIWDKYAQFYFTYPDKYLFNLSYKNYPTINRCRVNMNMDSSDKFFKIIAKAFKSEDLNFLNYDHFAISLEYNLTMTVEYFRQTNTPYNEEILKKIFNNFYASIKL